jgi:integrase
LLAGRDPLGRTEKAKTFDQCFAEFWPGRKLEIESLKQRTNYENSLIKYASPVLGALPVDQITQAHVLKVIEPMWITKTETARKLRGRIEDVINWAIGKGLRPDTNPARWDLIGTILPSPKKIAKVEHMAALPYAELPAFMTKLHAAQGDTNIPLRALEFTILAVCRTGDIVGQRGQDEKPALRWADLDLDAGEWLIPNPKAGVAHVVALPARAVAILRDVQAMNLPGEMVFPIGKDAMRQALADVRPGITVHGFRACFDTWASEETEALPETIDAILAHKLVADGVTLAYRRSDYFKRRCALMTAWGAYVGGETGRKVVRMPAREAA